MLEPGNITVDFSRKPYPFTARAQLMLFAQRSVTVRNLLVRGQWLAAPWKVYPRLPYEIQQFVVIDNRQLTRYAYGADSLSSESDTMTTARVADDSVSAGPSSLSVLESALATAASRSDSLQLVENYQSARRQRRATAQ